MAMIKNKALEEGISVGLHIVQPSIDQFDQCVQMASHLSLIIDAVMLEKAAAMFQWRNHNPLTFDNRLKPAGREFPKKHTGGHNGSAYHGP